MKFQIEETAGMKIPVSAGLLISGVKEIVDVWTPIMHAKRVRCGGDPIYDCYDELPESSCSKPNACEDAPQRCAKTCNLCRKRGDYTCVDLEPEWCKKVGTWKFGCRAKSNYLQCKKTCGAVKCGYGADDCFDELPESNCQKSNACVGGLWSKANHNPAGCKKTCNLCN